MRSTLRTYLALVLALVMTLTGHAAASMQVGGQAAVGQMVLCTGSGPVVVYTDSDGQPTPPPHHCPDCVLSVLEVTRSGDVATVPFYGGEERQSRTEAVLSVSTVLVYAVARSPPLTL
ncbi:hypothetical protein RSK20926_14766 [Roseobacter sp. SK209-2-6]|uniref:hypothetical protein n=1 Tax=Roseobacter sp. SK209-2-6 TaxID=388739 RepID=UPI0000F3EEDD|nr:hypothetical protein [Roseobacter sp. SK209-2-6]EBA15489.1 hypothetical protein RSK20926_14766 [Roseobacter sp. SK209-2-6]